ncbi:MAG: SMC-Scp complex subunit ScpB [Halieaceae bacterium]|nr:SMC-Scp complex subunit ScpB [Halieaceae bacterium]
MSDEKTALSDEKTALSDEKTALSDEKTALSEDETTRSDQQTESGAAVSTEQAGGSEQQAGKPDAPAVSVDMGALVKILEGAMLAAGRPLTVQQLGDLFESHERPANTDIREALKTISERCEGRGFELLEVASGFRFQVRQELSPWVARLWVERPARYSRALLETLSLIAYRQPITRGEIEEIRGVAVSSNIIKTLHERDWIRVVGHRDVPGRPAMYATTRAFLDYFSLKSLDQLPALAEIRDFDTLTQELGFDPIPELSQPQVEAVAESGDDTAENIEAGADAADDAPVEDTGSVSPDAAAGSGDAGDDSAGDQPLNVDSLRAAAEDMASAPAEDPDHDASRDSGNG